MFRVRSVIENRQLIYRCQCRSITTMPPSLVDGRLPDLLEHPDACGSVRDSQLKLQPIRCTPHLSPRRNHLRLLLVRGGQGLAITEQRARNTLKRSLFQIRRRSRCPNTARSLRLRFDNNFTQVQVRKWILRIS